MKPDINVPKAIQDFEELVLKTLQIRDRGEFIANLTKMLQQPEGVISKFGSQKTDMHELLIMLLTLAWQMERRVTQIEETLEGMSRMVKSLSPRDPGAGHY